jgi:hypothetical protein
MPTVAKQAREINLDSPGTGEHFTYLDATHTSSEKIIYSIMYRETISKGLSERHFGPAELMTKTGIRSRNTVHKALYGLIAKQSIEIISEAKGNPYGPRYKVHVPQEIARRRKNSGIKIDPQTKRIVESGNGIPAGIPTSIPAAIPNTVPKDGIPTIPNNGTLYKEENSYNARAGSSSSSKILPAPSDDEAFAEIKGTLRDLIKAMTGKDATPSECAKMHPAIEVLAIEGKRAAANTTVSSAGPFLAEHLKRRLLKETERESVPSPAIVLECEFDRTNSDTCPRCSGTGMESVQGKGARPCPNRRVVRPGNTD